MNCPNCGDAKSCRYVVSRKKNWKGEGASSFGESKKPREDFRVKCSKCGYEGEIR